MENELHISATQKQEEFRIKCLANAGLSYSIAAALPILLSAFMGILISMIGGTLFSEGEPYPDWYYYLIYLLPQISFGVAAAIYFLRTKETLSCTYRRCKWYYFPIAILLQFGLLFSLSVLNNYFIALLERFGYVASGTPIPSLGGWRILPAVCVIALLPAIFEETLFRGILSRNMHARGWGLIPTVLIAGAMFSLFHGNPEQTIYQFICGICLTLVAIRAGSIFPTIIAHFLNNAAILVLTALGYDELSSIGQGAYIALCVISAICFLASLVFLVFFDKKSNQRGGARSGKLFFLAAAVGIIVCAAQWIYIFITGFING